MSAIAVQAGGIEHRAAKVSLVNGLSTVLTLVFQLITVPVCLKYWGKESYGSWLALMSAFMTIRSIDGGFVLYVGNKLNYLYHKDTEALRSHLASALAGIVVIGILELVLTGSTFLFRPLATALGMPDGPGGNLSAQFGLLLLVVSWALSGSYLGIVHRLLIPAGMMYQAAWWAMAFQIAQFGAVMAAAILHLNMLATSLLFSIAQIGIYVASALYVRRMLPRFCPWLRGADARLGLSDLRHSLLLTGSNVVQQCATNGTVLVVAALAGPASVPVFTTIRTVANLWTSVTTVLTTPLLPEVVRIHAKGEIHKLLAINEVFWVLVGSTVNLGALLLYPLLPFLYGLWTGHAVPLHLPLLCLMLASVIVANAGALMALHLNGINSLRIVLGASLLRAIFGLGCGALGFPILGVTSFGVGILAGELAATLLTARHFIRRELTDKGLRLPAAAFAPVLLSTGAALLFFVGTAFGWWGSRWVWLCCVATVAAAFIWGWTALDGAVRSRLYRLASR